ncbi:hypothetical protein [Embleya sp. NPDC005575]|uniref:hypothetical protein n=1 Tax=Embleya sp. NPDC005575 TaxID=3156892 RepID=UPI0033B37760
MQFTTGSGQQFTINGNVDNRPECECGNATVWNGMSINRGVQTYTCGACGKTHTRKVK